MGPRKKKTTKDNKKRNLKDPPAEDPFPDWPSPSRQPSKVLEKVSPPATSSDISRLHILQRKSGRTVDSPPKHLLIRLLTILR
jgi:hypothetical protein